MKIIDKLTHAVLRRVAVVSPLVSYRESAAPSSDLGPEVNRYRFEATLRVEMTGRPEDLPEMRRRAARMLLHEIYGDVTAEIDEALRDLWTEEGYRPPNDPVSSRLLDLVNKLRNGGL